MAGLANWVIQEIFAVWLLAFSSARSFPVEMRAESGTGTIDLELSTGGIENPLLVKSEGSAELIDDGEGRVISKQGLFGGDVVDGIGLNRMVPDAHDDPVVGFKPEGFYDYWTDGVVRWQLHPSANTARSLVVQAIQEIESRTCIRFRQWTTESTVRSYVSIESTDTGYVGMDKRGSYRLNLQNSGCYHKGIVIHELMHAMGFYHEHQRFDRDDYITVNFANVREGASHNFLIQPIEVSNDVGVPYDYQSIMHYDLKSFGKIENGTKLQTIFPADPTVAISHISDRPFLSFSDALTVNLTYAGICNSSLPRSEFENDTKGGEGGDSSGQSSKNLFVHFRNFLTWITQIFP